MSFICCLFKSSASRESVWLATFIVNPAAPPLLASYSWSNGASSQSITVTTVSGNYEVTVTNSNNCTSRAAKNVTVKALLSDINLDGITNVDDFLLLEGKFNQHCTCPEDLNHDSIVNVDDFLIFLGQYNSTD